MSSYYVLSGENALAMMLELGNLKDLSAYFLKHEIEQKETDDWDASIIPELIEMYASSRACIELLREIMEQEPPPEYRERLTGGGVCVSGEQYKVLSTVYGTIKELKRHIAATSNLSFEVH